MYWPLRSLNYLNFFQLTIQIEAVKANNNDGRRGRKVKFCVLPLSRTEYQCEADTFARQTFMAGARRSYQVFW